jgi:hypothetical protein
MNILFLIGLIASTAVIAELRHRFEIEAPNKESDDSSVLDV